MKTVKLDIEHARELEQTLSAAFRTLNKTFDETADLEVREALLDIIRVRRDLDSKIFNTVTEEMA